MEREQIKDLKDLRVGDYWSGIKITFVAHGEYGVYFEEVFKNFGTRLYTENDTDNLYKGENRMPYRGDMILVWDGDEEDAEPRIFLEFKGKCPLVVRSGDAEDDFKEGRLFDAVCYLNWKHLPEETISWDTPEEIKKTVEWLVEQVKELKEKG